MADSTYLLRINDVTVLGAIDVLLLDIEISGSLFPACRNFSAPSHRSWRRKVRTNLNGGVHDDVRLVVRLSGGLSCFLPLSLHGKGGKDDS